MRILNRRLRAVAFMSMAGSAVASAIFGLTSLARADELPTFRKGMWQFTRTLDSAGAPRQTFTTKQCTVPSVAPKKGEPLASQECKFSPVAKSGNAYHFSVACKFGDRSVESKSVITADGDSAYKIDVDSQAAGQKSKEQLIARRIGDC